MEQVILWLSIIVVIVGALGTVLPLLPGTPIIFVTALLYGFYEGFTLITHYTLVALGFIMAVTLVIDYLAGTVGAKKYGASKYGTWGSFIGGILGFVFFNLPGIIIGPLAGAIVGEIIAGKKLLDASRVGIGTLIGIVAGSALKFSLAVAMAVIYITRLF